MRIADVASVHALLRGLSQMAVRGRAASRSSPKPLTRSQTAGPQRPASSNSAKGAKHEPHRHRIQPHTGKGPAAGGLAVALRKVLSDQEGFWFGWSGKLTDQPSPEARIEDVDGLSVAQIDLTRDDHHAYYAGFSNSILWPSFHLRLDLATIESHWYEGYRR